MEWGTRVGEMGSGRRRADGREPGGGDGVVETGVGDRWEEKVMRKIYRSGVWILSVDTPHGHFLGVCVAAT